MPIPVPLPFFSFTGWKGSFYGDQHAYGKQAVRFYTETKTITSRWFESDIASGPNMTIASSNSVSPRAPAMAGAPFNRNSK